eukprot:PhF_6_TR5385/c0_g1_i1/m.7708
MRALHVILFVVIYVALIEIAEGKPKQTVAPKLTYAQKKSAQNACNTCKSINSMGSSGHYVCLKDSGVKCNINVDGWCCSTKKENKSCWSCFSDDFDDNDDDDDL